jgi:hypothetical protein
MRERAGAVVDRGARSVAFGGGTGHGPPGDRERQHDVHSEQPDHRGGDTVTFQNRGGTHNAVSDPGSITAFRCADGCDATGGSGNLSSGAWSATVAFPTAGTVRYFCQAPRRARWRGHVGRDHDQRRAARARRAQERLSMAMAVGHPVAQRAARAPT